MVSITLSVSDKTKKLMNKFPEINWSGFIRQAIQKKAGELSWKEEMLKKLKEEESITDWAKNITQKDREKRIEALKNKGLL
ncbi:hypothetical protein B6U98_04310 [Thermoplasmatales archaeon ex4572_165]|nr:MAG: hypothetical protein B6U98_04310 [Thermoplasmatales archaeon ex4572_165]